jgi:tRNA(fMet)-specific endonuclease VapC
MYILDTDHISVFDRGGASAQPLLAKIARINPTEVATTIVTYEEQTRGWLSYIAKADTIATQILAYGKLEKHLINYRSISVLSFDEPTGKIFQTLRQDHPRMGSMDLKIADITLTHQATLLTRNLKDFGQIPDLRIEDWTI